jgi:hypothetical protein
LGWEDAAERAIDSKTLAPYGSEDANMKNVLNVLIACVLLIPTSKVFGQEAQAPVYKEGECWVFRSVSKNYQGYVSGVLAMPVNGDHKICFLGRNFWELNESAKSRIPTGSVWNNILYMRENRNLEFPLIVGRKRADEFKARVRGTNRIERRTSETSILAVEDVTSSAGTYQTYKIEKTEWCRSKSCGKWIYFYSPQTKSVVKYNYEATLGSTATWEVDLIEFLPVQ